MTQIQLGHSKMKLNQDAFLKQTFFWGLNVNKLCSNHSIVTCTNVILAQCHTHFTIWNVIRSFVYKKYELPSLLKYIGLIDFVSKGYQRRMEGWHSRVARRAISTIIQFRVEIVTAKKYKITNWLTVIIIFRAVP